MNKLLLATVTLVVLTTSVPSYAQQATTKDRIEGTWKVLSLKGLTAGRVKYPLGEQPEGYVTITATRLWLLFVDSRRPAPNSAALTDPEAIAGTDRVYFMKVDGNKLTMKSPGVIEPMTGVVSALVIELEKAD
jgi:hypothetical protein